MGTSESAPAKYETETTMDALNRPVRDLRVSLTDRCNFRCTYCMPKEVFGSDFSFLHQRELLTFDEITRLVRLFAAAGVKKVRLTGGEPLLRPHIEELIERLVAVPGIEDIALTTNGSLLSAERAKVLKAAGLKRITVSLDALDDATFMGMNDVRFPVAKVLSAVDAAIQAGLTPVKVNMVVKRGVNDDQIVPMAKYFRGTGCILRFIEFMDVGTTNHWRFDEVVTADEILERLSAAWPLQPAAPTYGGEVARRYRYADGQGEIGIIASVTRAFCGTCTRARLSPEGQLFTCLFGETGYDLRTLLRSGGEDEAILAAIRGVWMERRDRYSELRAVQEPSVARKVEMSHIGG